MRRVLGKKRRVSGVSSIAAICVLILLFAATCVQAGAPDKINYQGKLTDPQGVPVSGTKSMEFAIYNVSTGGSSLWTSHPVTVTVTNGLFNYVLQPSDIDYEAEEALYLEARVEGTALSPRERITSTIYALNAATLLGQTILEILAIGSPPPGAIAIFASSCPPGWESVPELDERFVRGAETETGGALGGYATHTHTYAGTTSNPPTTSYAGYRSSNISPRWNVGITYSGTTDGASSLPPYKDVIFCRRLAH